MKKLLIGLAVIFFLVLLSTNAVAYCNETRIVSMANNSQTSSDYNMTLIRSCTEEYDNSSFAITAGMFMFFAALTVVGMIFTRKIWFKIILGLVLELIIVSLLRFSFWFINITNPLETNLIGALERFYGFSVTIFYLSLAGSIIFLCWYILEYVMDWKRRKNDEEWE